MGLGGLSILESVLILKMHHHSGASSVPAWLYHLVVTRIGHIVCLTWNKKNNIKSKQDAGQTNGSVTDMVVSDADGTTNRFTSVPSVRQWVTQTLGLSVEFSELFDRLHEKERIFLKHKQTRAEWRRFASVLDRLFVYIFLLTNCITVMLLVCMFRTDFISNDGH